MERKKIINPHPSDEVKETVFTAVHKHHIIAKIIEIYGYVLKDNLPTNYITNRSQDVINACKRFYEAFNRKMTGEQIEIVEDMSLEYFETIDAILSFPPEEFLKIKDIVKAQMEEYKSLNQELIKQVEI